MKKNNSLFYKIDPSEPSSPPSLHIRNVLIVCFTTIILTVLSYGLFLIMKTWPIDEYSIAKAGTFGDSFGALNSLFTGLGFAGLLITIFLQREDLKLTRLELSDTRAEIRLQSQTFRQQQFEESFYRLLSLYRENLAQLSIKSASSSSARIHGIDALSFRQQEFDEVCTSQRKVPFPSGGSSNDKDEYTYDLYKKCNTHFSRQARYIETLNAILLLIEKDCFTPEKQEHYLNILSSQFTTYEIKYLFYQAFLNPKYEILRSTLSTSASFQDRFSVDSIPSGHYKSFEHLWQITLTQEGKNGERLFSHERFKTARSRIAQRRQKRPEQNHQ
jgi:hypothetical protein